MYFNEGGRTAHKGPLGGCLAERFLACPDAKKLPRMPAAKLGEQPHRAEVHEREAKNRLGPALKAWRAMCTVEDKTGIPLPGCAIGSQGARWA
jgi:hypothetical protein